MTNYSTGPGISPKPISFRLGLLPNLDSQIFLLISTCKVKLENLFKFRTLHYKNPSLNVGLKAFKCHMSEILFSSLNEFFKEEIIN
jgi:hypothetical protein